MEENHWETLRGIDFGVAGEFKVKVEDEEARNRTDSTTFGLHRCVYTVGPVESQKMVKKGSLGNQISKEQFVFLASLNKHPNAFFVENYYMDGDGIGCLVVESLNGRFQSWLNYQVDTKNKQPSAPTLFTADGRMLPTLRTIILSLCSFVEHVLEKRWYPRHLTMDDLYLKMMNNQPTLKVLMSDVIQGTTPTRIASVWNHVKEIITHCCTLDNATLSGDSSSFYDFIGRQSKRVPLETYPDAWSYADKSAYLLLIMQEEKVMMKRYVQASGIVWPTEDGLIQPMLQLILNHDKTSTYDTDVPWDYIRLCRNVNKKFDVPKSVKAVIKDHIGFLKKMEEWTPMIWANLYETIGPLSLRR